MNQHQRRPQPLNLALQGRLLQLRKEWHGRPIDESIRQPRPIGKNLSGGQLSNDHVWKVVVCVWNVRENANDMSLFDQPVSSFPTLLFVPSLGVGKS
eukprot:COSAG06_NODE_22639_length_717_cov_1.048544_1_plen_97_part_00